MSGGRSLNVYRGKRLRSQTVWWTHLCSPILRSSFACAQLPFTISFSAIAIAFAAVTLCTVADNCHHIPAGRIVRRGRTRLLHVVGVVSGRGGRIALWQEWFAQDYRVFSNRPWRQ